MYFVFLCEPSEPSEKVQFSNKKDIPKDYGVPEVLMYFVFLCDLNAHSEIIKE